MSFDPASVLSDDEKQAILDQRLKAWAADAYSHQLNKVVLEAQPQSAERDAEIAKADKDLATLTRAVQAGVAVKVSSTLRKQIQCHQPRQLADSLGMSIPPMVHSSCLVLMEQ